MNSHFRPILISSVALVMSLLASNRAMAAWPSDIYGINLTPAVTAGAQVTPAAAPDSGGGAIIAWVDARSGVTDIYAQRVDYKGQVRWTTSGVAVCTRAGDQVKVRVCQDGQGGAYLAWEDQPFNSEIYCQHLSAAGTVVAGWPVNGLAITAVPGDQNQPSIVPDGLGGAFVAWHDYRNGSNADIYVQRLVTGGVAAGWPASGLAVCTSPGDQGPVSIASDPAGGVWVAWHDGRTLATSGTDIYMQKVFSNASIAWAANGLMICGVTGTQRLPVLAPSSSGAVTVAWTDLRDPGLGNGEEIYVNYVLANGTTSYGAYGNPLATGPGDQNNPTLVAATGGSRVYAAWETHNFNTIDIIGSVLEAGVPGAAIPLCTESTFQQAPFGIPDGAGGAIFGWTDSRYYFPHVHMQRLGSNGQALWTANGVLTTNSSFTFAVPDLRGGAIVGGTRAVTGSDEDVIAARMDHFGVIGSPEPIINGAKDVSNDQGGLVHLTWKASYLDADPAFAVGSYHVWRRITGAAAKQVIARGALATPGDGAVPPAVRTIGSGVLAQFWEYLGAVPARAYANYAFPAPSLGDSTASGRSYTVFMVDAQAAVGSSYWSSYPDSGYSVDNLPPFAPASFAGSYSSGATQLSWGPNGEADLAGYRLYRGASSTFVPGPGNLIAAQSGTGYSDAGPAGSWYKLSAIDAHGNESLYATWSSSGTVDVTDAGATAFFFSPVAPNPTRGSATLAFGVPATAEASLVLFDVKGRAVRHLHSGLLQAGRHAVLWNARDDGGSRLGRGLYFARLTTVFGTETRRLILEL